MRNIFRFVRLFMICTVPMLASARNPVDTIPSRLIKQNVPLFNGIFSSWGFHWADFNNDGKMDFITAFNPLLYINQDSVFFQAGIFPSQNWRPAIADFDNDGDVDVYSGGFHFFDTGSIQENDGNGNFSPRIPFIPEKNILQSIWCDYNNDGFLDLYVSYAYPNPYGEFYRNNGDKTFTYAFRLDHENEAVSIIDYDGDGDEDLIAFGSFRPATVYERIDTGFVRNTKSSLAFINTATNGVSWGDIDNDGDPDLFIPNPEASGTLYSNLGGGRFLLTFIFPGSSRSRGGAWGDFDNDGFLDLYLGKELAPNKFYYNNRNGTFSELPDSVYVNENFNEVNYQTWRSFGAAWCDYNEDGFLDLSVGLTSGSNPSVFSRLYLNETNGNNWIKVLPKGVYSNADAIGAKIKIKSNGKWQYRWITSLTGTFNQNSLIEEFGLGTASIIDSVVVFWPVGNIQVLTNLQPNQTISITEVLTKNVWTGSIDNSWHNPQNWSLGMVPDATTTAIIESGTCEINAPAICSKVIVKSSAILQANQNLTIVTL